MSQTLTGKSWKMLKNTHSDSLPQPCASDDAVGLKYS